MAMSPQLHEPEELQAYYAESEVVASYLEKRTVQPAGRVLHKRQVAFINEVIARERPGVVLEIAPGPGRLTAEVRGRFLGVALERNEPMLDRARHRVRGEGGTSWRWVHGNAFTLPFDAAAVDLAYTIRFIRHFQPDDRSRLYAEIHRVLTPGGLFVLEALNRLVSLPQRRKRGLHRYPVYDELYAEGELTGELEGHGFSVEHREGILKHYPLQMRLNRLRRLRLGGPARLLISALDRLDGPPNTWMVSCRKR
jgi:ubiquinone/menaquinone biosynthesis C-methylase UbiE